MKLPRALLLSLIAVVASAHAAPPEKPNLTIAVGGRATLYYLPLTLAERLGYFRDEGSKWRCSIFRAVQRRCRH